MPSIAQTPSPSKKQLWTGRVLVALLVLFLLWDSVIKLMNIAPVVESFVQLGYPVGLGPTLGFVELTCVLLYAIPRTSVFGAILLTGYLGGATATKVRLEDPWFLFSVGFGVAIWIALWLRDARLRTWLIPRRPVTA